MSTTITDTLELIGEAAGIVWRTLESQGPISLAKLVKAADLPKDQVLMGLGWLAREDKIDFDDSGKTKTIALKS